jgi:predicted acyl esterase
VQTQIRGEAIEKIYTVQIKPVSPKEYHNLPDGEKQLSRPYAFNQRTYEAAPGIICEQDTAIEVRDGTKLYADVFRPSEPGEKIPAIIAWSNYGKRPNEYREGDSVGFTPGVPTGTVSEMAKFEGPDPAYWCRHNYAVVNIDIRGVGYSEGYQEQFCSQDGRDGHDVVEWLAGQDWCNGKVTLSGTSALAMSQWFIAAEQPPHLACIAPWEGISDLYRESLYEGGVPNIMFTNFATDGACGLGGIDDQGAMALRYPLMNNYWRDKIPDFARIDVPAYVCACWNHFHLRGSVVGFMKISSRDKWLRAHREFEWPDYYSFDKLEELRRFFDRYCKGVRNGWEETPKVRIDVMDAFDEDRASERAEAEFPLARTEYRRLYLDAAGKSLSYSRPEEEAQASYDSEGGLLFFEHAFAEDTEITGFMKLHAWVEAAGHDDMDLFVTVKKLSASGVELPVTIFSGSAPHPGAWGKLRVSHRELDPELSTGFQPVQSHERALKLSAGEVVEIDVEIWPTSRFWHAGETLRLQIAGNYIRDPHWIEPLVYFVDNKGEHVFHTGPVHESYLQIPVVGPRHDHSRPFVVDESKHPTHPIF